MFEWYVVRCGFKNQDQNDMCVKKRLDNVLARSKHGNCFLSLIVNMIGETYTTT